jgi:hypothetical protein
MDPEQEKEDSFGAKLFLALMVIAVVCVAFGVHLHV